MKKKSTPEKSIPRHKYDKEGECYRYGRSAETRFCELAAKKGWEIIPAEKKQDMIEHWDFRIVNKETEEDYKVEVKAIKKISRKDENVQDKKVWIELHGGGKKKNLGWLYGAESDFIAFEMLDCFYLVDRYALMGVVNAKVNKEDIVKSPHAALYRVYQRRPPDLLTLIMREDLDAALWQKWMKYRD